MNRYELIPVNAADDKLQSVLTNLTKMYCYEWSQYTGMDIDKNGEYTFEKHLPSYWTRLDRKAFLLKCIYENGDSSYAGMALLDKDYMVQKDTDWVIAEFFVMFKYRRSGAGSIMAKKLFDMFPGRWEVGRNPKNITSVGFWDKVINDYTNGHFELKRSVSENSYIDGTLGDVFIFDNSL